MEIHRYRRSHLHQDAGALEQREPRHARRHVVNSGRQVGCAIESGSAGYDAANLVRVRLFDVDFRAASRVAAGCSTGPLMAPPDSCARAVDANKSIKIGRENLDM